MELASFLINLYFESPAKFSYISSAVGKGNSDDEEGYYPILVRKKAIKRALENNDMFSSTKWGYQGILSPVGHGANHD